MPDKVKNYSTAPAQEPLFTVREIAREGKVSEKTVRRLIDRGELKIHRIGTQIRITGPDWQAYLAGGEAS